MLKVTYQIRNRHHRKHLICRRVWLEDKILAAIEAMKVELRAEMKAEIAAVKKSVSLDDKIPQFKSGQPSNYFDSH